MSSYIGGTTPGRRRQVTRTDAEERALDKISREAESRMKVKRETRELARQHRSSLWEKKVESTSNGHSHESSSGEANNCNSSSDAKTDPHDQLLELDDKFQRTLILYSQLDNEKSALLYEMDLLKDDLEEKDVLLSKANRESRDLTSDVKLLKRNIEAMQITVNNLKREIAARDQLIQENGLVLVEQEPEQNSQGSKTSSDSSLNSRPPGPLLFAAETIRLLNRVVPGNSSLDQKVRNLIDTNKQMRKDYEEMGQTLHAQRQARNSAAAAQMVGSQGSGIGAQAGVDDVNKDAARQLGEMKQRMQELERDLNNQQGNTIRIESQMKRYKQSADQFEKENDELKAQLRQIKKEMRDKENALDEAKETNKHLQSRLEKMRNQRTARPV
ncbi:hypothetical protein WR25_20955 [Diploscapter pachys]|uniref:Uncharacterized protein n=1 Tax=Diploscapter pachys TaxID=2018661 RepID=A0A2A2JWS5_9BILA|nr:hypothetical protein WR25_20955 [Diploscapter pachys]